MKSTATPICDYCWDYRPAATYVHFIDWRGEHVTAQACLRCLPDVRWDIIHSYQWERPEPIEVEALDMGYDEHCPTCGVHCMDPAGCECPAPTCQWAMPDMYPEFAPEPITCNRKPQVRIHYADDICGHGWIDLCLADAMQIRRDILVGAS